MYLGRSSEGLLMGDAYTAVADDEMTLFYNPAALVRNRGVRLVPLNGNFQFPDVIEKDIGLDGFEVDIDDRFNDWPSEPELITDRILGYPIYMALGSVPTVKIGGFGMSLFALNKTQMVLENTIHPTLNIDYRYDYGFIMGYALNLTKKKNINRQSGTGHLSAIGLAFKNMSRQSLKGRFDLFGTELLEIISNSDNFTSIRENLGYSKGSGKGFDLGWEHSYIAKGTITTFGVSWLDIGGTRFKRKEGRSKVANQETSLNLGSAFSQDFRFFDYTLALDYHNAFGSKKFTLTKLHLGTRWRFPIFNFYMGYNGGYRSWGLSFDFLVFNLKVGFYGKEFSNSYRKRESKRTVISLNLIEMSFDDLNLPL